MPDDTSELDAYLRDWAPTAHQIERWPRADLELTAAITSRLPPESYIGSVRAILFRDDDVMVMNDPSRAHLLPGGHREPGETMDETLAREMFEETGYAIASKRLIGVMCFKHLTPPPPDMNVPMNPWFFNAVFQAEAGNYHPTRRETDGYELSAEFHPIDHVRGMNLDPVNLLFLNHCKPRS
ncbi:MAG TPA: NUDIX hydrolase [Pseudomonadales bacterium]|nr:NUDIX hydrolase [Pseudomonadales bacterium]